MNLKEALGLGPADGRTTIPVAVWVPVAVVAFVAAIVVLQVLDATGFLSALVVAVAFALVFPVSTLVVSLLGARRKN